MKKSATAVAERSATSMPKKASRSPKPDGLASPEETWSEAKTLRAALRGLEHEEAGHVDALKDIRKRKKAKQKALNEVLDDVSDGQGRLGFSTGKKAEAEKPAAPAKPAASPKPDPVGNEWIAVTPGGLRLVIRRDGDRGDFMVGFRQDAEGDDTPLAAIGVFNELANAKTAALEHVGYQPSGGVEITWKSYAAPKPSKKAAG